MTKKLLFLISILFVFKISGANNFNTKLADNSPPKIFNFRIEASEPNRVYFDSNKIILGSKANGFVVSNKSISAVTINSGQLSNHYFTISSSFSFWDNNTIRYEGGSDLRDEDNNALIEFTLIYINNNIPEPETSTDRYVTTSASGGGDGTSESSAWTLSEAFYKAKSGMTVWIKAGNYGNKNLRLSLSGTPTNPIKFVGYKYSKGDITQNYLSDYNSIKNKWSTSEMPTLTGGGSGFGIDVLGSSNVFFRNLQFTRYNKGIQGQSGINTNLVFDRINGKSFTYSFILFEIYKPGSKLHPWTNSNFKITNSVGLNSNLANFFVAGDGSGLYKNVRSYSDAKKGDDDILDYHIVINGDNSIITNCHSENVGNLSAGYAHGIGVKGANRGLAGTSDYNLIVDCTSVSVVEGFYFRSNNCNNNVIKNCTYTNPDSGSITGSWKTGGVWLWGGVNNNVVENVSVTNATYGIAFFDNQEENNYIGHEIGNNNIIRNSTFNKTKWAVYIKAQSSSAPMHDNKIINCVFNDSEFFLKRSSADVKNLNFINCSFSNIGYNSVNDGGSSFSQINFSYSNFYKNYNNWFWSGEGNTNLDPKFVNGSSGNFRLTEDSPLIDVGKNLNEVKYDFDGGYRPQGKSTDIGAFEFGAEIIGAINLEVSDDVEICNGSETVLTASGNGEFLWSTGETSSSITVSPEDTTTYTVTASIEGNSESEDVTVTITEKPSVSLGEDINSCQGVEVNLTAQGTGNFLWSTGETSSTITVNPTETTQYMVTASSECGSETLSVSDTITINIAADINLDAGKDITVCSGTEVTLVAEGNGDFLWNTGETTASIIVSPSQTTTYSVSSTYENCTVMDEVVVTVTEQPEVTLGEDLSICSGNEAILTAQGNGDFLWSTGETSPTITVNPLVTTEYIVTASTICGTETLSVSDTLTVTVTPVVTLNAGNDVSVCLGTEVTLTAEGNGSFLWSTGETTASIIVNPTETTTYSVVSGSGDCKITDEVVVTITEQPEVTLGEDITICSGNETILTAQGSGNFLWSTGETTPSISVNPIVNTEYTVVSSTLCGTEIISVSDTLMVNVTPGVTLDAGNDVAVCSGTEVILTAEGNGSFLWNTGETTASITVNPTETTTYSVSSGFGDCEITDEVLVEISEQPEVTLGEDLSICSGNEVVLTAQGTGDFLWSTGETTSSITVSPNETTEYIITSSSVCGNETISVSDTLIVNVTPSVTLDAGIDQSICLGNEVILTAEGNGSFLWNTGETTASITVSPNETTVYSVTSGSGDCTVTDEVTVTVDSAPTVNVGPDITVCFGVTVVLTAQGNGDFFWSTGETTSSIEVSPTSTTLYTVKSNNSCGEEATDEVLVTVIPEVELNVTEDTSICLGETITLNADSNSETIWSTGETTSSIEVSPLETTVYYVTSGSGDCTLTDQITVTVNKLPSVNLGPDVSLCLGETIILAAVGNGDFLWSTGETTKEISVNPSETSLYSVSATSCGETVTDEILVNVGDLVSVDAGEDKSICKGESVTLTADGIGDFLWSTGETTSSITVNPNSSTLYWVTSTLGNCSVYDDTYVSVEDVPTVSLGSDVLICSGEKVTLVAEGTGNFLWSTGETASSIVVTPNVSTTYTVTASSSCSSEVVTDQIEVTISEPVYADAGDSVVIELGQAIQLTASGGNEFLWSTGETTASIMVEPTISTEYTVKVNNQGLECFDTDTVEVAVVNNVEDSTNNSQDLVINSGVEEITICKGDEITLNAKGALHYLWNTKDLTSSITVNPQQTETYYVSALRNGVLETTEVTIIVRDCSTNKIAEFKIYPNPTKGIVNVHIPSQKTKLRLQVISLNGQLVLSKQVKADRNGIFTQIDLSSISKGVYLLKMDNESFNETKKILVI